MKINIITKVVPGTKPLLIVLYYEIDGSSDADNLSIVSMTSAGGIGRDEFQALLSDITAQHQKMAASMDALAARVEDMTIQQVEEAAAWVTSKMGHI